MKFPIWTPGLLGILLVCPGVTRAVSNAVVQVPVADVRRDPTLPAPSKSDDLEETQVLFGEPVQVTGSSGDWTSIQAPEQQEFSHHNRWEGYPGWVLTTALSTAAALSPTHVVSEKWISVYDKPDSSETLRLPLGAEVTRLQEQSHWFEIDLHNGHNGWVRDSQVRSLSDLVSRSEQRRRILKTAELLVGDPYVWGGRSPLDPTTKTRLSGTDCSGFVHLSYRVNGVVLPRDSAEQYRRAGKMNRSQLQLADLIFSALASQPDKITHVALYMGDDWLLEAPQTGIPVRRIRAREKLGKPLSQIESGTVVGDRVIYFGRYLPP